ncbi:hypothetical protein ACHAXR_007284 [Thalassiosira sp. AJA248-18]
MGFFRNSPKFPTNRKQLSRQLSNKKCVHFTDVAANRHEYEFDWELEPDYWYSKAELKTFNEVRFDDADVLRKERGIRTASRNDADDLSSSRRSRFVGDKITNALDDADTNQEISIRGIEHFVFPVLQKEMVRRKKELKKTVLGYSRDPKVRKLDPQGLELAKQTEEHSKWARDVATERGIKYCEMKRGLGRGGGLLQAAKGQKGRRRRFSALKEMDSARGLVLGAEK